MTAQFQSSVVKPYIFVGWEHATAKLLIENPIKQEMERDIANVTNLYLFRKSRKELAKEGIFLLEVKEGEVKRCRVVGNKIEMLDWHNEFTWEVGKFKFNRFIFFDFSYFTLFS